MRAVNFSGRAAKNLSEGTEELKRKTVRTFQDVRKDPDSHLTALEEYPFYKVEIGHGHVAIVERLDRNDEIRVLTVGARESFHSPSVV